MYEEKEVSAKRQALRDLMGISTTRLTNADIEASLAEAKQRYDELSKAIKDGTAEDLNAVTLEQDDLIRYIRIMEKYMRVG